MHNVQSEKVAVFLPLNVLPPKKKSTSCNREKEKEKEKKNMLFDCINPLSHQMGTPNKLQFGACDFNFTYNSITGLN